MPSLMLPRMLLPYAITMLRVDIFRRCQATCQMMILLFAMPLVSCHISITLYAPLYFRYAAGLYFELYCRCHAAIDAHFISPCLYAAFAAAISFRQLPLILLLRFSHYAGVIITPLFHCLFFDFFSCRAAARCCLYDATPRAAIRHYFIIAADYASMPLLYEIHAAHTTLRLSPRRHHRLSIFAAFLLSSPASYAAILLRC